MQLNAQVVGTGADGRVPSVWVSTERSGVLFNVGEGTQRLAGEHGLRLSRSLGAICLTRLSWHHVGGLQDLLARCKPPRAELNLTIMGPPNLSQIMLMTGYFIWSVRIILHLREIAPEHEPTFETGDLNIQPVVLLPSGVPKCTGKDTQLVLNFWSWPKKRHIPPVSAAVCYICRTADKPGKFDAKKASELGVKGSLCRRLVQGNPVVTPDGRTVRPEEVISDPTPGSSVWIIDCPSLDFVAPLVASATLSAREGENRASPMCIFHMAPNDVLSSSDYARWMHSFGPSTQHVVLNKEVCPQRLLHLKAAQRQASFNIIDPLFFPLPQHSNEPRFSLPTSVPSHAVFGDNLLKFFSITRRGKQEQGVDRSEVIPALQPVNTLESSSTFAQSIHRYRAHSGDSKGSTKQDASDEASCMPDLRVSMDDALSRGLCTIYATGKDFVSQEWYNCRTCKMEKGYGCCAVCATTCHAGHDLVARGTSEGFYCDCGSSSGEAVPWCDRKEGAASQWKCNSLNGVPVRTVLHQFFPKPSFELLDRLAENDQVSEIVFLGTAAAAPSRYRNVSSIYIHLAEGGIILDAGEGTYGQLLQRYGAAEIDQIILDLKLCFISHMHGDHLLGLLSLLLHRAELDAKLRQRGEGLTDRDPIMLIAPLDVYHLLQDYNQSCPFPALTFNFIECKNTHYLNAVKNHPKGIRSTWDEDDYEQFCSDGKRALARVMDVLGLTQVTTAEVIHACLSEARAHAIQLTSRAGWKIVYSGDTLQPCQELLELGMGATVLIHEASFAQDRVREARKKFHSTTEEAIEAGMRMGAARIVLTHFSQQYVRCLPPFEPNDRTTWATDLMSIKLGRLRQLPHVVDPMAAFFADEQARRSVGEEEEEGEDAEALVEDPDVA